MERQWANYPSLAGKRVLITGGATGIGAALVAAFSRQRAQVAFLDIAGDDAEALCARMKAGGLPMPLFRHCDLVDLIALEASINFIVAQMGDIDVLVNNAANDQRHELETLQPAEWDRLAAVNQRPMFFTCQAVVPSMRRRGGGVIVNMGSIGWHIKSPGYPAYAMAKAAASGLTRGLARDLGRDGIRVNTVAPGWVMTERQLALWVDAAAEDDIRRNQCLPGRLAPVDVAAMVMFLAADDGAMCTGQEYIVDAGWS
ncbi:SDR family NAD(P)-dependent oxidoreductase [Pseudoduganella violaceinigra]|uniref:SDR family NAD(P)-dependent oxidoreductase n=1 Tax=Pseudoduganella violaceinigra TaxID=246602 RepID=UPI0003FEE61A|nr:SDR family oxidoreductase [Pseudoduganella violaceinigra]